MNIAIIALVIFVATILIVEMSYTAYRTVRYPHSKKLRSRVKSLSCEISGHEVPCILEKKVLSDVPLLNRCLSLVPGMKTLERLVKLANTRHTSGFFILLTLVLLLFGHLVINVLTRQFTLSIVVPPILGTMPFFYLVRKKKKRMEKLLRQLPDTLDLIGRALRAGHSFTTGMKLAADEFDDPIGPEFRETLDEINFGVSVTDAMKNLANRLDCPDLKYFVVSVIIQRETGGNLSEIMDSLSYLIRERFKLKGKIRVLSAEGRLSAIILVLLPLVLVIALRLIAPKYIETLLIEPVGRVMAVVAACLMILGVFTMKRIVNISV